MMSYALALFTLIVDKLKRLSIDVLQARTNKFGGTVRYVINWRNPEPIQAFSYVEQNNSFSLSPSLYFGQQIARYCEKDCDQFNRIMSKKS